MQDAARVTERDPGGTQPLSLVLSEEAAPSLAARLRVKSGEQFEPIPPSLLRKYIGYARQYVEPRCAYFSRSFPSSAISQHFTRGSGPPAAFLPGAPPDASVG